MYEMADRPLRVSEEANYLHWWRTARWFANLRLIPRWSSRYEIASKPLTRVYRQFFHDGLTRSGKIILVCSLLVFLLSYRDRSNFLLLTAALGISLLLWSAVLGFFYRPRVSVQRTTPKTAVVGQPLISQISITNEANHGLYNFSVRELIVPAGRWPREWRRPHRTTLAPGQRTTLTVSFEPQIRGVLSLSGLAVQSYFPFFLSRHSLRLKDAAEVYVLPPTLKVAVPSLRHIAEQASKRMAQGSNNAPQGAALEYAYSRQYQVGDSLRRLDHRASSRRGEPMSKIFEGADEIRRDKVYLLVDTTLADFEPWQRRPRNEKALDERLALAVEIGLSAQNEGFNLAALATGEQWQPIANLMEFYRQIATCKPRNRSALTSKSLPDTALADNGLYILVIGRWHDETRQLVERWQQAGVLVLVFLLAESEAKIGSLPTGVQYIEVQR
ncbi:MAG: DUF58 domain-containing protein [Pseudohongiellaceae bacterium]